MQAMPAGAETESDKVPVKPWTGVIVTVEVVDWPEVVEAGCVESMLMSGLLKVNVAVV